MEYFDGINHPEVELSGYLCDKCGVQPLIEYEYDNCVMSGFRYCGECFNYLHLQTHTDSKGNTYKLRSERVIEWQER